jgi:hypothetical protein
MKTESQTITCDFCKKQTGTHPSNSNLFNGFRCSDTGMFIASDCRKKYYQEKNRGLYGTQHMHKISEIPVPVPVQLQPNLGKQLSIKF